MHIHIFFFYIYSYLILNMLKSEIELANWWHYVPCDFASGKDCPTPKQKATTTLVPHLIGQTCQVIL